MLTYFIGSSYMSDFFCNNATYIELYISSFMGVVCVFLFRVYWLQLSHTPSYRHQLLQAPAPSHTLVQAPTMQSIC